jgi:hypothetical protein
MAKINKNNKIDAVLMNKTEKVIFLANERFDQKSAF